MSKFSEFYSKIFSHDGFINSPDHDTIKNEVESIFESTKNKVYPDLLTIQDIEKSIDSLKSNKAVCFDKIAAEMIKFGLNLSGFNISLITPVPKCKNKNSTNPEDFRPISVSSVFCTLFEKCLLLKIDNIFKFNKCQFGYTNRTSCKHASFLIKEIINYYNSGGSPCYVVSLDLSKAFDRLWRDGFL